MDWKSIIAGAIAASAIFGLLAAFGTAVGLSLTSAHRGSGLSASTAAAVAAALWMVMVHVWSFVAGGYLAGRLSDVPDLHPEEAVFRAGANSFMVWALGTTRDGRSFRISIGRPSRVRGRTSCTEPFSRKRVVCGRHSLSSASGSGSTPPASGTSSRPDPAMIAEAGRIFTVGLAEGSLKLHFVEYHDDLTDAARTNVRRGFV